MLQPDQALGTAACGVQTTTICSGSQNPAIDPMSVKLDLDADNPATAAAVQELGTPPDTEDSRALGNDVYAHADQSWPRPADPATITLALFAGRRDGHAAGRGPGRAHQRRGRDDQDAGLHQRRPSRLGRPTASSGRSPATSLNTFVTVLTTQTSRWRLRRQLPGEAFDQTAPGAARNLVATLAPPGDGSKVALSWAAPATDGGAAVSAYRVLLDGKLLFANDGSTSAVVSDPGPGKHSLSIVAVNSIGASAGVAASITIDKLSKPRKVKTVQGKKGGKLTAGAKWKAPADAGGFAITKYKVAVFKKNGKKVDTKVVKADQLKFLFKLKSGKYFFKVKARNTDRWGPWSKPTDPATITLRYSQADVMGTPLDEVQVVHTTDDLQQVLLPDCVNGPCPAVCGAACKRPVTRNGQNTFVTVLTTQTSRWRVRRSLPVENQGAPTAPRAVTVKEAKPFDGSVLKVSWTAPASSGAGRGRGVPRVRRRQAQGLAGRHVGDGQERRARQAHDQGRRRQRGRHERGERRTRSSWPRCPSLARWTAEGGKAGAPRRSPWSGRHRPTRAASP